MNDIYQQIITSHQWRDLTRKPNYARIEKNKLYSIETQLETNIWWIVLKRRKLRNGSGSKENLKQIQQEPEEKTALISTGAVIDRNLYSWPDVSYIILDIVADITYMCERVRIGACVGAYQNLLLSHAGVRLFSKRKPYVQGIVARQL